MSRRIPEAKRRPAAAKKVEPRRVPKPKDGEILTSEAAEHLGLTIQAIGIWAAKQGAPARRSGRNVYVRWPDFARWREQQLVAAAKRANPTGTYAEREARAKAERAEIETERAKLDLARIQGEQLALTEYEGALGIILDRLTARLRALPIRLSHFGTEVEVAAEHEVEDLVQELNAWDEDVLEEPEPADELEEEAA